MSSKISSAHYEHLKLPRFWRQDGASRPVKMTELQLPLETHNANGVTLRSDTKSPNFSRKLRHGVQTDEGSRLSGEAGDVLTDPPEESVAIGTPSLGIIQ